MENLSSLAQICVRLMGEGFIKESDIPPIIEEEVLNYLEQRKKVNTND